MGHLSGSKQDLRDLIDFTLSSKIYPDVEEMPFEKYGEAMERQDKHCPIKKIVVKTDGWNMISH